MPIQEHTGLWIPPSGLPHRSFKNPQRGAHAPDGRRYEVCPACSAWASLRSNEAKAGGGIEHPVWRCERCGYVDCDGCPLGDHERN